MAPSVWALRGLSEMHVCPSAVPGTWVMLGVASRRGCGSGRSLSPELLTGMMGVALARVCIQGSRTRLWDSVSRVSASRSLRISLAPSVPHLLVCSSLSVSLFLQLFSSLGTLGGLLLYFILRNSILEFEAWGWACGWERGLYWDILEDSWGGTPEVGESPGSGTIWKGWD